mgnify:CR=1 FL=1
MPDMREGGLGTAACYLTVERLALQAGVESPFWDETSLLMGGCDEPWYKKPLTPRRLRSFLKRYGGSLPDDAGRRGHAASVFSDVMRLYGIPLGGGADDLGALYVRRAESVGMTVAFLATGCTRRYGGNHGVLRGGDCPARHAHMGRRYIGADIRTHPYRVSRPHPRDLRIIR